MNQPPQTETQTGKRIVSKGEYVKAQGKRTGLGLSALCFMLLATFCGIAAIFCIIQIFVWSQAQSQNWKVYIYVGYLLPLSLLTLVFYKMSSDILERAVSTDIGVPLTRANTADLPAPDTLVRASAEPVQEPQAVLLRAATEGVERHEEQLVRASAGGSSGDGA